MPAVNEMWEVSSRRLGRAATQMAISLNCTPKGPKYPNMEYIYSFFVRTRNYGLGHMLHVWVLGPLGWHLLNG